MARLKLNAKVVVLALIALISLVVSIFNFTQFWGIHDLSNESVDSRAHVDMETQLRLQCCMMSPTLIDDVTFFYNCRTTLQNRAADLAIQLKEERDNLLNTLVEIQKTYGDSVKVISPPREIKAVKEFHPPVALEFPLAPVSPEVPSGLPGAAKHPILNYDDETLKHTPLSQMMSLYDPPTGSSPGGSCDNDFGNGLVERWRRTKRTYCSPDGPDVGTVGGEKSKIDCYLVKQTRHGGNGDQICVMENVGVHMDIFNDDTITNSTVREYERTKHSKQPYIIFPSNFVQSACEANPDLWNSDLMPGWNAEWTTGAVSMIKASHDVQCTEWIEESVLIDQRDTFANLFHDSEDFVNVFLAMSVLQMSLADTQIYLTDLYPKGPFWDIWKKPFGLARKPMTAWDLKKRFGHSGTEKRTICYRKLIVGIYGPASPLTVCSWNTKCKSSPLVKAFSDFIIRGMNLQHLSHYAQSSPSKEVNIIFMARRSSSQWPEKRYCDDQNSFFLCEIWSKWGLRSLKRTMRDEDKLLSDLKALERETFPNGAKVKIESFDFNLLSFEDQIKIDLQADIMIGPHGAGLMHSLFMRDRAALIELFVDGSSSNRHFHNMAFWYGRKYTSITSYDMHEIVSVARSTVLEMDLTSY